MKTARHVSEAGTRILLGLCRRFQVQLLILGQEIETWVAALASYDNNEFDVALKVFDQISDTSKILFNCGVIYATLGEHEKAVSRADRGNRMEYVLIYLGRLLPARCAPGQVPRRCLLPAGRVQLLNGRF